MSIWWADADRHPMVLVAPEDDWSDGNGSTMEPGNYGIWINIDGDAGAIMEGSLDDLMDELMRMVGEVSRALSEQDD